MQVELFMVIGYVLMSSSIGLYIAGSLTQLALPANASVQSFVRTSFIGATALMAVGVLCTLLHLGNIGYFYGILSNLNSWLTRESWLVGVFFILCITATILGMRTTKSDTNRPLAVMNIAGICVGLLLLFSMSMAYMTAHAIPSWNDAGVMVTNIAEMLALGTAFALLLATIIPKTNNMPMLRRALSIAGITAAALALLAFAAYLSALLLQPSTSIVLSNSNITLATTKIVLLVIALVVAIMIKKASASRLSLGLVVVFVGSVLVSDVLSRILHFTMATHIPLVF